MDKVLQNIESIYLRVFEEQFFKNIFIVVVNL